MHIAIFYCCARLPVEGYGGTERAVVGLVRGLAELGHRVTLIAPPGSSVPPATLVPLPAKDKDIRTLNVMPFIPADADVLHSFSLLHNPPEIPHVWTLEGNLREGQTAPPNTIFVSADHARRYGSTAFVYNGVDPADLVFRREKSDYDLFLGRLHQIKGYHWAIEGAKRTRRKLVVAGGWRPSMSRWVKFVGSVDGAVKAEWLAGARLLWMPALWDEPCAVVLLEALMSGTPILGTRRGCLPEIISPDVGVTGDSLDELVDLLPEAEKRAPDARHARALRYFSNRVMAEEYLRFYQHFLTTGSLAEGRLASGSES